jgi:hypothetical protein
MTQDSETDGPARPYSQRGFSGSAGGFRSQVSQLALAAECSYPGGDAV